MPLSEHEQRLLDELEASLSADDPRLATVLRGTQPLRLRPRRAGFAAGGFVVGLIGLVGGMQVHPVVSVLGFVVMLLSALSGLGAWARPSHDPRRISPAHPSRQSQLAHRDPIDPRRPFDGR